MIRSLLTRRSRAPYSTLTSSALTLTLAVLLAGCGSSAPAPVASSAPEPVRRASVDTAARPVEQVVDPARYFEVLEDHLLHRPSSRIGFTVTSEGAFAAALRGELRLLREGGAELHARGTFGSDSVDLVLQGSGDRLTGGNGTRRFDQPMPPALRESLVVGMMRMGVLHNLARLVGGSPPDRTDGTVRSWAEVRDLAWLPRDTSAARRGLGFDLWVSGQPAAEVVLWLDANGRPVGREQTVRFAQGEMRVREEYEVR